ncbi:MAG: TatD family hydrolase [Thermoproteota archaeon]
MALIFDAHIHLSDDEFKDDIGFILHSMEKLGIKACSVSMDNNSSQITLELAKKSQAVLPFIGIHPEKAHDDLDSMMQLIQKNSASIAGIGEIGLDKTYVTDEEGFKRQKMVFTKLLEEAERIGKPVSVHSRRTLDEILAIIPSYRIRGLLLHWFDGNKTQLRKSMELGCFVSYGPVSVYSHDKQTLISITDKSRILVETDGPVKFSHCFGMKPAQPSFIPSVIFCISKIFGTSYDDCVSILETNSKNYLGI